MASSIQLLRSTISQERPFPGNLLEGQPAVNLNASEPGLFFKAADGSLVKFGPAAITSDGSPPNSSPQGSSGNTVGELWLDKSVDPAVLKVYDGTAWVDAGSGGGGGGGGTASFVRWIYTAAGGETSLSGSSNGVLLEYTPGLEEVFVNGVLITRGTDYSATNGTSITNLAALTAGDVITVTSMNPLETVQLPGQVTLLRWTELAAAGQTVLSGIDSSGQQLDYSPGFEEVYVNGAFLRRGIDYTATNGSTITVLSPLAEDDEITVLAWSPFTVGEQITNADVADNAGISSTKLAFLQSGTGAVSRTIQNKLQESVSVTDFGAKGDGIDSDLSYIQNAINYLESVGGGTLFFPPGEYKVDGIIFLKENVHIEGSGMDLTRIHGTENYGIYIIRVSNVSVKKLTISGDKSVTINISDAFDLTEPPMTKDMKNFVIEDVYLDKLSEDDTNYSHGILVKTWRSPYSIQDVWINRCKVYGAGGFDANNGVDNIYIASYRDGLGNTGTVRRVYITNCHLQFAARQNISLAGSNAGGSISVIPEQIFISNCLMQDSALAGVDVEDARWVEITNCRFERNGVYTGYFPQPTFSSMNSGIVTHTSRSKGGDTLTVSNCQFQDCKIGVCLFADCRALISNCSFRNSPVNNGSFASFGDLQLDNCFLFTSDEFALSAYRGTINCNNCVFESDGATALIGVSSASAVDTEYTSFSDCVMIGDGTGSALLMDYRKSRLSNCIFENFETGITTSNLNRSNVLEIVGCHFRDVSGAIIGKFRDFRDMWVKDSRFERVERAVEVTDIGDFVFSSNSCEIETGASGSPKVFVSVVYPTIARLEGNDFYKSSASTDDVQVISAISRNTGSGVLYGGAKNIDISHNYFGDLDGASDYAVSVTAYSGQLFKAGFLTKNHFHNCTTGISSSSGLSGLSIISDNITST